VLLGCSIPRDLELSAEKLKCLEGTSRIELGFPQSIYERGMVRVRYGGTWDRLLLECDSFGGGILMPGYYNRRK
jgi:hypothetical protein